VPLAKQWEDPFILYVAGENGSDTNRGFWAWIAVSRQEAGGKVRNGE